MANPTGAAELAQVPPGPPNGPSTGSTAASGGSRSSPPSWLRSFGVLIYVSETHNKNFRLAKGQLTPQTTLVLGIVCGALLLGATFLGRRAPVGFVALFTFLMFGTSTLPLGLPFLVLAVWLLYRSYKVQKEATAKLRAARAEASASTSTTGPEPKPAAAAAVPIVGRFRQEGPGQARGQQALHAQAPTAAGAQALTPGAEGGRGLRLRPTAGRRRHADSVTSAERSSSRISFLRRTNDRAVGSSPKARSTSTSVSMPITVE